MDVWSWLLHHSWYIVTTSDDPSGRKDDKDHPANSTASNRHANPRHLQTFKPDTLTSFNCSGLVSTKYRGKLAPAHKKASSGTPPSVVASSNARALSAASVKSAEMA